MNYYELIQLYFERSTAMRPWPRHRRQIGGSHRAGQNAAPCNPIEPTLTPATWGSVKITHLTSDLLTIAALIAMEIRRRALRGQRSPASEMT